MGEMTSPVSKPFYRVRLEPESGWRFSSSWSQNLYCLNDPSRTYCRWFWYSGQGFLATGKFLATGSSTLATTKKRDKKLVAKNVLLSWIDVAKLVSFNLPIDINQHFPTSKDLAWIFGPAIIFITQYLGRHGTITDCLRLGAVCRRRYTYGSIVPSD